LVPNNARTTEEMLRLVPHSYREASIGLGATKATTIVKVVLPSATASIVTGVMLAIARVAGETAPLLFTALKSDFMPVDVDRHFPFIHPLLSQPFPSLTVQAFNYARDIDPGRQHLAWAGILVLIGLVFLLNLCVRFATRPKHSR
jgi:phosphate transport system permease protein